MHVLELFAGSRSVGKAAEQLGFKVFSTDWETYPDINHVGDIMVAPYRDWGSFDVVWASPDCTSHSIAAISHHWTKGGANHWVPKSQKAILGMAMIEKTLEIIDYFQPKFFFIENPTGGLRKKPIMSTRNMIRQSVRYCQYGDNRAKPTDIWTNSEVWVPRPMCKNGDTCHEAAPRGSKTGTQGRKNAHERSKIPHELCLEILRSCL